MGLNPEEDPEFVSVHIDDIFFSETLEQHINHLRSVLERLREANLKVKPQKCLFVRDKVLYLGHVVTPQGLKPNPSHLQALKEFPEPQSVSQVRQFLGLASYYRRFIPKFAATAQSLHNLTRKDVKFEWTEECQFAFYSLKMKLTQAPVLTSSVPSFWRLMQVSWALGLSSPRSKMTIDCIQWPLPAESREELWHHGVGDPCCGVGGEPLPSIISTATR